jgi:hypothetical protein
MMATENGLLFGNYFWELPGSLNSDSKQAVLMLRNGCSVSPGPECEAFSVRRPHRAASEMPRTELAHFNTHVCACVRRTASC